MGSPVASIESSKRRSSLRTSTKPGGVAKVSAGRLADFSSDATSEPRFSKSLARWCTPNPGTFQTALSDFTLLSFVQKCHPKLKPATRLWRLVCWAIINRVQKRCQAVVWLPPERKANAFIHVCGSSSAQVARVTGLAKLNIRMFFAKPVALNCNYD